MIKVLSAILTLSFCLLSCQKEHLSTDKKPIQLSQQKHVISRISTSQLSGTGPYTIGDLHNEVLSRVLDSFTWPADAQNWAPRQCQRYISDYNQAFVSRRWATYFSSDNQDNTDWNALFLSQMGYYDSENSLNFLTAYTYENLYNAGFQLTNRGILSSEEYVFWDRIVSLLEKQKNNQLTVQAYKDSLSLLNRVETCNGASIGAKMLKNTIIIGLSSADWWLAHPTAHEILSNSQSLLALPPTVYMDAGGALWGMTLYAWNNTSYTWSGLGKSALVGAVAGSVGVVGKIAKGIQGFLKL